MKRTWLSGVAVGVVLVVDGLLLWPAGTAEAEGDGARWHGGAPSGAGVHLALWGGGTIEQAAATPGARSIWLTSGGQMHGYVVGAPAFANAAFRALFPDGVLPPDLPMLVALGATEDIEPVDVVHGFLADLAEAAPPAGSEAALVRSLARLTEETRSRHASSGQLAGFLGVQDLPDGGVTLMLREQEMERSRVHALLHYSGGDAEREFLLLREQNRWRLDWVDAYPVTADASPERVAESFVAHFIASAPPAVSPQPATRASELLSEAAQASLEVEVPLASALAALVGVQDVPDQGFETGTAVIDGDEATVIVTLHYSGGDATRVFTLVLEDGEWRIDAVSAQP